MDRWDGYTSYSDELYHYGIKNQRWGTRRFQYEDGSLTPEGKERYGRGGGRGSASVRIAQKALNAKSGPIGAINKASRKLGKSIHDKRMGNREQYVEYQKKKGMSEEEANAKYDKGKERTAKVALGVAGAAVVGIGVAAIMSSPKGRQAVSNGAARVSAALKGSAGQKSLPGPAYLAKTGSGSAIGKSTLRASAPNISKGKSRLKSFFSGVGSSARAGARKAGRAASNAANMAGYHARRAGANVKNFTRGVTVSGRDKSIGRFNDAYDRMTSVANRVRRDVYRR